MSDDCDLFKRGRRVLCTDTDELPSVQGPLLQFNNIQRERPSSRGLHKTRGLQTERESDTVIDLRGILESQTTAANPSDRTQHMRTSRLSLPPLRTVGQVGSAALHRKRRAAVLPYRVRWPG